MSKLEDFNTRLEEIAVKKKALLVEMQNDFGEIAMDILRNDSECHMICWAQIVPFFNDGEACYFSVGEVYAWPHEALEFVDDSCIFWGETDDDVVQPLNTWKNDSCSKAVNDLMTFISDNDELMEEMFGSHARVIITRDAIHVEEYTDHD